MGPPASTDLDRAVVEAVLAGEVDAFRLLVERESAAIIGACLRILADHHEAEDVAQEAFVTAFRALGTWRADGPFGAWVSRIAVRLALRRAANRRTLTWIDPTDESTHPSHDAAALQPVRDPLAHALQGEREQAVRAALARLDEPYREVVALRFFADLSLAEIASVTGRPVATIKTHLRRGLLKLRSARHLEAFGE